MGIGKDCPVHNADKCILCLKGFKLENGKCVRINRLVDLCKEFPKTENCKLSNAKFADGKYFNAGKWDLQAQFAIDGKIKSTNLYTSFAHSASNKNAKFTVNVPKFSKVSEVVIYPRRGCCWDRYANMRVVLSNSLLRVAPELCLSPKLDATTVKASLDKGLKFTCSGKFAADTIEVTNNNWIQIAEIEAF